MNRISRRSAAEAAEALLEVGRTEPVLHYDVEVGLARHHHWLRSDAPLPEWAGASVGTSAKTLVPVVIKTVVSAVLMGALATAAWYALDRPQPSPAGGRRSSPGAERTQAVAPNGRDVTASEAWMATTPIPVSDHVPPNDHPRQPMPDKPKTRSSRAHKELATARAASATAELGVPRAGNDPPRGAGEGQSLGTVARASSPEAKAARAESASPANTPPSEQAARHEAAPAPERKPTRATEQARPEPAPQAQAPDDLAEMQEVATAEQLLERAPERALSLVRQSDQRFAHGYFRQERAYIAIMALIRLGRIEEARGRAASFGKQFPARPYGARIRSALEAHKAAAPGAGSRDATP